MSRVDSVRNPDGIWVNTQGFREEALRFKKKGVYCLDPWGSNDWFEYWQEQRRRCIYGHSSGGAYITGDHYFYLNFCPIKKTEDTTKKKSKKITDFPDFWDGDYNYFWARDLARKGILDSPIVSDLEKEEIVHLDSKEEAIKLKEYFDRLNLEVRIEPDYLTGGWNLIVGKSRRKGYSFKNAAVAVNNYLTIPNSLTILGGYEKKFLYPKGLFTMAYSYINFVSENTAWVYPRQFINQPGKGHLRASTQQYTNGVPLEVGFKSEIMSISFKDDPDSARGKDAHDFIIDEAGAFGTPGLLKDTLVAIQDVVKDGDIKTGMITVFGTSGDMEGGTADYADMHSKPVAYGFMPFKNIWDEDSEEFDCGFFHPNQWNLPGYYDEQGNSNQKAAIEAEKAQRKFLLSKGATSSDIQKRMQERPLGPSEAFGFVTINNFPVLELKRQLEIVKGKRLQETMGTPVEMYYDSEEGKVKARPILDGSANPIYRMKPDNISLEGCPVIYEYPMANPPRGAYKIGFDPYRQDEGSSLASIIVYKPVIQGEHNKMIIVAEYIGRPQEADDVTYIAKMFAMLYNTQIMYENEVTHVKDYFRKRKELHYLAVQPDAVISKSTKVSRVSRIYGCHMNTNMKDAGEKYIKTWLLDIVDYDENGQPVRVLDKIYSIGLLEELISYHRKGNFDRVMALMQVMFQDQEDMIGKEYKSESSGKKKVKQLLAMQNKMYNKNTSKTLSVNFN
jgi:hypothetical protein